MKPYDKYKKTNIPWLEEVPEHWDFLRNKNVMAEKKDVVGSDSSKYILLSLTLNGVIKRDMENAKGKFPKDFDTYKIVNEGEMIFCLFDIDETPRTVGLSKFNGMITGAYDVFAIININSQYLYYYYLSVDMAKAMKPLYTGLRKVIGVPKFLGTKLPVPPRTEQDHIVHYLDWQIAKINKLVKAKKKQIELLKEHKQAVINKAVTKGLDDSVPMKDSGIEWLGKVPAGWEIIQIKKIATLCNGKEINNEVAKDISSYNVYGSGGVFKHTNEYLYNGEAVLFGRKGTIGKPLLVNEPFWTVDTMYYSYTNTKMLNHFLYYLLIVFPWHDYTTKTALPSIVGTQIFSSKIPLPSVKEQQTIVDYLDDITAKIDTTIAEIEQEITLISEYKTSLISSVVTGKVDVRDVVVPKFVAEDEIVEDEEVGE